MRRTSRPAILPASRVACRWLSSKWAGTVITARVGLPALCLTSLRMRAESSSGVCCTPLMSTQRTLRPSPASRSEIRWGIKPNSPRSSSRVRPMRRLTEKTVWRGSLSDRALASEPTRGGPCLGKQMTLGTRLLPSGPRRTTGLPSIILATKLFVVPRSMPTISLIQKSPCPGTEWALRDLNPRPTRCKHAALPLS